MDEQDEELNAIEREYRRNVVFTVVVGGLGLLVYLFSVHLHLTAMQ